MEPDQPDTLRVVLLAPNPSVREAARRVLEPGEAGNGGWRVEVFDEPEVRLTQPDALLIDGTSVDVAALLERGRNSGWLRPDIPVLVLVETPLARETQLEWLRAGAWELVRLPLDQELVRLQLRNLLRSRAPIASIEEASEEPYGRSLLLRVVDECLSLAFRYRRPLTVVATCLDWGKRRADPTAQNVLHDLAGDAQEMVRRSDLVGVTAAGTLVILLPDTDRSGAQVFVDRLEPFLQRQLRERNVLARLEVALVPIDLDEPPPVAAELVATADRCFN